MAEELELQQSEAENDEAETSEQPSAADDDPLKDRTDLQQELKSLVQKFILEDLCARLVEVRDVTKRHLYWRDLQYIAWSDQRRCYFSAAQGYASIPNLDIDDMPHFEFVTNIYQSRGLGWIAAIVGAPIPIRFFPADTENPDDIETAEGYEKLAKIIERWNPIKMLMQEEAYYAWNDGVMGLHTENIADETLGVDESENIVEGTDTEADQVKCQRCNAVFPAAGFAPPMACPECGAPLTEENIVAGQSSPVPMSGGTEQKPKTRQVINVVGALNLRRPQYQKEQSDFHYLIWDRDVHYTTLRAKFPDKADDIKPGAVMGQDDMFERSARLACAQGTKLQTQSGGAQQSLSTYSRIWFRPSAFYAADQGKRDELLEIFPKGCRFEFAGPTYLTSAKQSMDDCWAIRHALPGDGQHRPSGGSSLISVQDRFNTHSNIEEETFEYGIGTTYRAATLFDKDAREQQTSQPGDNVDVMLRPEEDIRQKILQVQSESPSQSMHQSSMELMGPVSDEVTGTFPAVTGAAKDQPDTLGQQVMQRDQAMGRMGIPYSQIKQLHADIMTLACRDYKAHASGKISIPVKGKTEGWEPLTVDITALQGDAKAYPEGDEAFPEMWGQKRNTLMQIADSPQGQVLMQDPENADAFVKYTGIPELRAPGSDFKEKVLSQIAELTAVPPGEQQSLPMPPDIDPLIDEAAPESIVVKHYLNGRDGRKLKRENQAGYQNVHGYLQALEQLKTQQAKNIPMPLKPATVTIDISKLPPEAQAELLAREGIELTPADFIAKAKLDAASKHPATVAPPAQPMPIGGLHAGA